ncbi:hypothetical protein MAM1_0089c04828 [Mucor ambiguus]|uniref:Uncharacterized protein n=1 Tax=Mucor ambiguus TaxID=91626 RepID=A0A0C9MTG6_9FUNG|nr:hypothetical protein MAM1_0089c04828 [Mucor ambiguus]
MSVEASATNQKSNYAFEIRFIDDNIVQVFDIAAKRKQQNDKSLLLPTEYKQEEVLKGQLRYSKLMGSDGHVEKDAFGLEETGLPYQHIVTTKRSKNRRSTQRHTFMMGGSAGGESGMKPTAVSTIHDGDEMDDGYDSGTAVTEVNDEYLQYSRNENESLHKEERCVEYQNGMNIKSSISTSLPASIQELPVAWQPPTVIQQREPVVLPLTASTALPPPVKQRERSAQRTPDYAAIDHATLHQQPTQNEPTTASPSTIEMYQSTHSTVTFPTTMQDYTSITAVNTNHSSNYMPHQQQQQQQKQQPKRGCCCIIS